MRRKAIIGAGFDGKQVFSDTSDSQSFSRRVYAENMCDKHCRKPFSYGNSPSQVFRHSNFEKWTKSAGLGVQPQIENGLHCPTGVKANHTLALDTKSVYLEWFL